MPEELNIQLRYGSDKHKTIKEAIWARHKLSKNHMQKKYGDFNAREDQFKAYIPEREIDRIKKEKRENQGLQDFTTLDVPYSYAIFLSAHTYWTSVFLGRNPLLQFNARHGEPEDKIQAVEAIMDYQVQVGRMLTPYYIWLHDAGKYGFGVLWNYWDEEQITVSKIIERPRRFKGVPLPGTSEKVKTTESILGYQGNKVFNVSPYNYFPDPRVSLSNTQEGEFVGRKTEVSWNDIVTMGQQGHYFNLDALKSRLKKNTDGTWTESPESPRQDLPQRDDEQVSIESPDITSIGFVGLLEFVIRLIPKDWKLGKGESPELWQFTLAQNEVIIGARPYGAYHGKFPAFVLPYEIDGYEASSRSLLSICQPLNNVITWLFNTHFYNVRNSLKNQFIFDPSRVVVKDVMNPAAGNLIRLKEAAYGTDVRSALTQLQTTDVTTGNLRDIQIVSDLMQRISGVTDNIMGMVNAGGRKTATEVRTSSTFGINRLKTTAEWWSAGDFSLLSQVMMQNTQQYYDQEREFKIAGDLTEYSDKSSRIITGDDIAGFYDFVPVDGTMPVDRFAQANLWKEILFGMGKLPQVGQQYDLGGIFAWMAQLSGLKNVKRFKLNVVPDAALTAEVGKGNNVGVEEAKSQLLGNNPPVV